MLAELTNHIWQSTLFAIAAGLMTLAFRKNGAQVRYWLWLSASLKFLLPFSLLIGLGSRFEWAPVTHKMISAPAVPFTLVQMSQPFPDRVARTPSARDDRDWMRPVIFGLWACGFLGVVLIRLRGWRRIRTEIRSSTPLDIRASIAVRSSPGLLEPGVVGLFRPILLVPAGITECLQPRELQAVLAHELCHVRRRDNLTSAIHMIVEAVFWFHPLVWWIGARLVEERERACDEAVLSMGNEPHDYAAGILSVCKSYLESPLSCVSGVTGSDLKKRIRAILMGRAVRDLNFAKKLALAVAGITALIVPIVVGIMGAPHIRAQSATPPKFEVVSIKPCPAFRKSSTVYSPSNPTGVSRTWSSECTTVQHLVQQAGLNADGHANPLSYVTVTGGPAWTRSELYKIDAKAEEPQSPAMMNGPVLQAVLEDRFKLKVRRETREIPVYELRVAAGGPKLQPFQGTCIPWDYDHPNPGPQQCATVRHTSGGIDMKGWTIPDLLYFFKVTLDRPVIDETKLAGRYDFHLAPPENLGFFRRARGDPAFGDPAVPASDPSVVSAIKAAIEKLGLKLEPAVGPGEFLIIDYVEKPSAD
jgi:uncharacterized protein (TIGR03435 family)